METGPGHLTEEKNGKGGEHKMKATLEFVTPDEENEFKMAIKGSDFFCALWDVRNEIRNHDKYDLAAEECIDRIREIIFDAHLDVIE